MPVVEGFVKGQMKLRLDKCVGKQMKPLQYTSFSWVDTVEGMKECVEEIGRDTVECNLLAVDLEYHTFARVR